MSKLLVIFLAMLAMLASSAQAQNAAAGGVAVVPAPGEKAAKGQVLLIEGLEPGSTAQARAEIVNTSDSSARVYVYPADGIPAQGGGFGYSDLGQPTSEVGAWLRLDKSDVVVPAGGRVPLLIDVLVGRDAYGGRNVGAVVVEAIDQPVTSTIATRSRYAMPVTVTVLGGRQRPPQASAPASDPEGPRTSLLQLRDLEANPRGGRLCPTVVVGNGGAAVSDTRLRMTLDGLFGSTGPLDVNVQLPPVASTKAVHLRCVKRPIGPSKLKVVIDDLSEPEPPSAQTTQVWVPLSLWISLLLLLLLVGALISTYLRGLRRRRDREAAERAGT